MTEQVRPSLQEIEAYLAQAKERIRSAEILAQEGQLRDALSRVYYAFFDTAVAALLSKGVTAKTHQGIIALFNREFIVPGVFERGMLRRLTQAKDAREEADYETQKTFTKEQIDHALDAAREFLSKVEQFLKNDK